MSYYMAKTSSRPFETVVADTIERLRAEGFGVLTDARTKFTHKTCRVMSSIQRATPQFYIESRRTALPAYLSVFSECVEVCMLPEVSDAGDAMNAMSSTTAQEVSVAVGPVAATLLIVGGNDREVLTLNQKALAQLPCEAELEVVPWATHLFVEPGALEQVASLAAEWFIRHAETRV